MDDCKKKNHQTRKLVDKTTYTNNHRINHTYTHTGNNRREKSDRNDEDDANDGNGDASTNVTHSQTQNVRMCTGVYVCIWKIIVPEKKQIQQMKTKIQKISDQITIINKIIY